MIINKLEELNNITNKIHYDYKDIFYENSRNKNYIFLNSKLDNITQNNICGFSLTIKENNVDYFLSSNTYNELKEQFFNIEKKFDKINQEDIVCEKKEYLTDKSHNSLSEDNKLKLIKSIDNYCRNFDNRINQVKITLLETFKDKSIVQNNIISHETRISTRLAVTITAKEKDIIVSHSYNPGFNDDYSFINEETLFEELQEVCKDTIIKLSCVPFKGGNIPVIINAGFGAVLFHEACGHAMESYSIVDKSSILTDKLNSKIASNKVTIIDDGSKDNLFGTSKIDDQGELTKKNILIQNGILKNYLTDLKDCKILNNNSTGSARRENYSLKAISRMNNTYLENGDDLVEDMIKSIDYGIYAKNLGGGSVDPSTGRFNFFVSFAYIIKDGKLTNPIKDITLIGTIFDVLEKVEMVSNDLTFSPGNCGAESGSVPVTCGQPTIKITNILVGGNTNE